MASKYTLSEGVFEPLMKGQKIDNPIVQILGCKPIPGNESTSRYRLLLSDGKYSISFAMYALKNPNEKFDYSINCIIRITHYVTSLLPSPKGEKKVLVILSMDHIASGEEVGMKIGNPVALQLGGTSAPATSTEENYPSKMNTESASTSSTTTTSNSRFSNSNGNKTTPALSNNKMDIPPVCAPIISVCPYNSRWCIRARVMNKGPIRTWSNSRGEGKLFSFDVCDESGDIRVTAFNEDCDKFYNAIETDKVYYISCGNVKVANKKFNTSNHDYEINVNRDTQIMPCEEDCIPLVSYNFIRIADIPQKNPEDNIDVIGIVKDTSNVQQFVSRAGKNLTKREVTLVDKSGAAVSLTLWGDEANNFDGSNNPVVVVKNARITEFMGSKSLATLNGTTLRINPDIVEAHALKGWFHAGGLDTANISYISAKTGTAGGMTSPYYTFREALENKLGTNPKGDYYMNYSTVLLIKSDNCVYKSCPNDGCNKKVVDAGDGTYRCDKCSDTFQNFKYRLLLSLNLGDHTSSVWATCFADEAEKFLGKTSEEIGEMYESDKTALNDFFTTKTFSKVLVKLRVKMEGYQDEQRFKSVIMKTENSEADVFRCLLERLQKSAGLETSVLKQLKH